MNGGRHVLTGPPGRAMGAPGPGEAEPSDAELIERSRTDPGCLASIFDRPDRYDTTRPDARPWLYGIAVRQIGRRRLLPAAGAIAAAAIAMPSVLPGPGTGSLVTAAWAVQRNPDGTIEVTFKQARDVAGLQRYLRGELGPRRRPASRPRPRGPGPAR